jgi:outer membrane immunogenic protein
LSAVALALGSTSVASAADLPVRKAPPPVVAVYNWTGFYIGGHVGGVWGDTDWLHLNFGPPNTASHNVDGWLGGGQVGFNWQVGPNWVLGIEADFSWTGADGQGSHPTFGPGVTDRTELDSIITVAGRLGYAWGPVLLYSKGGGAWVREEHAILFRDPSDSRFTDKYTRSGWMVGAGLEYGFTPNFSMKVEYNFLRLNDEDLQSRFRTGPSAGLLSERLRIEQDLHIVKAGLNYRFGGFGGPVRAGY